MPRLECQLSVSDLSARPLTQNHCSRRYPHTHSPCTPASRDSCLMLMVTRLISFLALCLSLLQCCEALSVPSKLFSSPSPISSGTSLRSVMTDTSILKTADFVPVNGIIDYIGKTTASTGSVEEPAQLDSPLEVYKPPSTLDLFWTRFALWRQLPWKKINGKIILTAKVSGDIRLEAVPQTLFSGQDAEVVSSLEDIDNLFRFAAYDPRVQAILLDIKPLQCGYAKLIEIRRNINFFKKSGKPVVAYCESGSEKEFFLSLSCDEVYVPPDAGFDLRGFSSSASFVRGVLDKIGIEPQVQRIGKYKSAGDTLNRYNISEAQREVVSSLLMETSNSWIKAVSDRFNMSEVDILELWATRNITSTNDLRRLGLVSGIMYQDQVHEKLKDKFRSYSSTTKFLMSLRNVSETDLTREFSDFTLDGYFEKNPRRLFLDHAFTLPDNASLEANGTTLPIQENSNSRVKNIESIKEKTIYPSLFPAGRYLKKMRKGDRILKGLPVKKIRWGPRIAVINAVGAINSGKSSSGSNPSIGSDTVIEMVRECRKDKNILGVVIRVDSPGRRHSEGTHSL